MSVILWKEIHNGRDGDSESGKSRTVRRYSKLFRATTNNNYDDALVVKSYAECPRVGSRYPSDMGAWCRRVSAVNASFSKVVWTVTANYSSEFEIAENPLSDPADIDWDATSYQRPYFEDIDGKVILNTAGDYPDPPLEGDDARWVVNVRKNLPFVPTWVLTYKNSVNSAAFVLDGVPIAERQAKLSSIKISTTQERNDVRFRVVSFAFHIQDYGQTWDKRWLNQGMYCVDPDDDTLRSRCKDKNGAFLTSPALLDEDGYQITDPSPETAYINTHKIYKEKDFSALPIT